MIGEDCRREATNYRYKSKRSIRLKQESALSLEELKNLKLTQIPGFKFTWYYSGLEVKMYNKYYDTDTETITKSFVRNCSTL